MFSIDLTQQEIVFLRQALEVVQIHGKDAKFVSDLQLKLEHELQEIEKIRLQAEEEKIASLQQVVAKDKK